MKKLKDIISGENELIKIKMNKLENENKIMILNVKMRKKMKR